MAHKNWIEKHITLHEYDNPKEEQANAWTHLIGVILSLAAFIYMIGISGRISNDKLAAGMVIYTLSMLLLYGASSLYHYLPRNTMKRICRVLDHSNIYILIAGTYTPILLFIGSQTAGELLVTVWLITLAGILFTLVFWGRMAVVHVLLYLAMGWLIVFFWGDIVPFLPEGLLFWILAGGITYTVGVGFYAAKRLPYYHAVWHLFVLGGSAFFFTGFAIHLI
ncbi:MAG: PAQR family membrane homeostasis protein TrhA [Spirochaetota bacterium]